eukprot:5911509-Prymnesium_polylepis.1
MPPPCPHVDAHRAPHGPSTYRLVQPAAPPLPAPAALSSPHAAPSPPALLHSTRHRTYRPTGSAGLPLHVPAALVT